MRLRHRIMPGTARSVQAANFFWVLICQHFDGLVLRWGCTKYVASGRNKRLPKRRVSQKQNADHKLSPVRYLYRNS